VLYTWGDALAWAQKRLSAPVNSTSELGPPLANKEKAAVAACRDDAAPAGRDQATITAKKTRAVGAARVPTRADGPHKRV
jgi:hypothetical protein